jgi:hypothetical protein
MKMPREAVRQLMLTPLDETSWRLCDRAVLSDDPASLVAYVQQIDGDAYEVVWISHGAGSQRFVSLDEVFRAAIERLEAEEEGSGKPRPIPHYRPLAHR